MRIKAMLCVAASLGVIATSGTALTISESTVGDFFYDTDPSLVTQSIGTLDFGLNTVSGTLNADCTLQGGDFECDTGPDRGDAFLMTVGPGEALLSINLTTSGTAPAGYQPSFALLDAATFTFIGTDTLTVFNGTGSIINALPVGAGTYVFAVGLGGSDEEGRAEYDWELAFEVGAAPVVPLPAGLPLMLGAVGAFAWVRRKQRAYSV